MPAAGRRWARCPGGAGLFCASCTRLGRAGGPRCNREGAQRAEGIGSNDLAPAAARHKAQRGRESGGRLARACDCARCPGATRTVAQSSRGGMDVLPQARCFMSPLCPQWFRWLHCKRRKVSYDSHCCGAVKRALTHAAHFLGKTTEVQGARGAQPSTGACVQLELRLLELWHAWMIPTHT